MTVEESISMWNIEKANINHNTLSKKMLKLYNVVDKYISKGLLLYDEFTKDMINMAVNMVDNDVNTNRLEQIDTMCSKLINKYEDKYKDREPIEGDN